MAMRTMMSTTDCRELKFCQTQKLQTRRSIKQFSALPLSFFICLCAL